MGRLNNWVKAGSTDGRTGYKIQFEYDAHTIETLKSSIPSYLREWDDDKKTWWISELCEKKINDIFPGFLEAVVAQRKLF